VKFEHQVSASNCWIANVRGDSLLQAKQNAEFICFCFNLQQKYDIGLFEETVELLSTLTEKFDYKKQSIYSFAMNDIDKAKSLLLKLKQNK